MFNHSGDNQNDTYINNPKDYKSKYYKYKNKYLILKNSIGGSRRRNEKILMDEVYNDTKCIILGNQLENRVSIIRSLILIFEQHDICYNFFETSLFYQDWFKILETTADKREIQIIKEAGRSPSTFIFNTFEKKIKEIIESYYRPEQIVFTDFNHTSTLQKGGNYIAIPKNNKYLTLSNDITSGPCRVLPEKICLNLYNPDIEGHVDEILCFMPYTDELFKLWFYKPVFNEDVSEAIKTMITTMYLTNKEILIREFPDLEIIEFDLEFSSTGSILNPPLFNRLCIKKGDQYIFIFPDQYNESIKSKVEEEITKIKEYYTNTFLYYVDSIITHNETGFSNVIGGNLHCLTKQFV